jgi:hypothetical protein
MRFWLHAKSASHNRITFSTTNKYRGQKNESQTQTQFEYSEAGCSRGENEVLASEASEARWNDDAVSVFHSKQ